MSHFDSTSREVNKGQRSLDTRRSFIRKVASFGAAMVGAGAVVDATAQEASAACFWDRYPDQDYCDLAQTCSTDSGQKQLFAVYVYACCSTSECYGNDYYVPQPPQMRYYESGCCEHAPPPWPIAPEDESM